MYHGYRRKGIMMGDEWIAMEICETCDLWKTKVCECEEFKLSIPGMERLLSAKLEREERLDEYCKRAGKKRPTEIKTNTVARQETGEQQ